MHFLLFNILLFCFHTLSILLEESYFNILFGSSTGTQFYVKCHIFSSNILLLILLISQTF